MKCLFCLCIILLSCLTVSCSSDDIDKKLERSLRETSLEGYGNYSSVSLQSSATFLLHRHLSQLGAFSTEISSIYVKESLLTVNLILKNIDFDGFAIYSPDTTVVQLDLSEEQRAYILKCLEDVYYVTLSIRLSDEEIKALELEAEKLEDADLLFSLVQDGKVVPGKSTGFYVWTKSYGFRN